MGNKPVAYFGWGGLYSAVSTLSDLLHNSIQVSPIEIAVQGRGPALTNIDAIIRGQIAHALPIPTKYWSYINDRHGHSNNFYGHPPYLPVTQYTPHGSIRPSVTQRYKGKHRNQLPRKHNVKPMPVKIENVSKDGKRFTERWLPYMRNSAKCR